MSTASSGQAHVTQEKKLILQPLTHGCSTVSQRAAENFGLGEIEIEGTLPVGHVRFNIDHPLGLYHKVWR